MPTKTKLKPAEIYTCWQSFAGNDGLSVAEGTRLRGDHELVQRFPDRFTVDGTPDDEIDQLKAAASALPPAPEPLGRVKLRVRTEGDRSFLDGGGALTVSHGGRSYSSGETFEAEGANAQLLIDSGNCEIVQHLRSKQPA